MSFFSTALAMLALLFAVGAPVALLVLPRRWCAHWPIFAPVGGVATLSLYTWIVVWADLRIHSFTAWAGLLLPCLAAGVAIWRLKAAVARIVVAGLLRHAGVLILAVAVLHSLAQPLIEARVGLTSVSFGSCDAADYAAGGNLFVEFRRSDRQGFLAQTETVALRSVETFHAHWTRLNHFAPAGILAWFSSVFELPIYKLVTALGIALHAAAVPAVFWLARAAMGLPAWAALVVAACWGCSAPSVYGVGQTALGQIMAVPAVAILTWCGLRAWREGRRWKGAFQWLPLAVMMFVVLVAAYTFALVFVLAPLALSLAWLAWRRRDLSRLGRAAAIATIALAITGVVFFERMAGLVERFSLFEEIDFGWFIPVFTVERWLGWFGDAKLDAGGPLIGWLVVVTCVVTFCFHAWRGGDRERVGLAASWLIVVAAGYGYLGWKGLRDGTHEVYNAYKVFALMQPLTLVAVALPMRSARSGHRWMALLLGGVLLAAHWKGAAAVRDALRRPTLWVDKTLAGMCEIAGRTEIDSLNLCLEPMWPRLWLNGMVLGKRQYFRTDTYEGRRATPLRGEWDVRDRLITIDTGDADTILLNRAFYLSRRTGAKFVEPMLGNGWYGLERGGEGYWIWSSGEGTVHLTNPGSLKLQARLKFGLQGNGSRTAVVVSEGRTEPLWSGAIDGDAASIQAGPMLLQPGTTTIRIQSPEPATPVPGDGRVLSFALHDLYVQVEEAP